MIHLKLVPYDLTGVIMTGCPAGASRTHRAIASGSVVAKYGGSVTFDRSLIADIGATIKAPMRRKFANDAFFAVW
ncbi:MAG: hypothetical protein JSR61_12545 [Proteobacteria bacterium]|nr:hypothetical protein [Pseudomonadota bacterium]